MTTISVRKYNFIRISFLILLLLTVIVIAMPAGASPRDQVITFDPIVITYSLGNFTSVAGHWDATEGLFEGSGSAAQSVRHSGWPGNGWQFRNAHVLTILSDGSGTVTIQDQTTGIDWAGPDFSANGRWVIKDGTGSYAGIHGNGISDIEAKFHASCPTSGVNGPCLVITMNLHGLGHFE